MGYRLLTIGLIGLIGLIGVQSSVQAQDIRGVLRDGNRNYKKEKWEEAENWYRHAIEIDSMDYRGLYNLGDALYRQKKYDEAANLFDKALGRPDISSVQRSRAFHNKGNSYLKAGMEDKQQGMEMFQQAILGKDILQDPKQRL